MSVFGLVKKNIHTHTYVCIYTYTTYTVYEIVRYIYRQVDMLTESKSSGKFSPLLMPLFMEIKWSSVVFSFTQGL